jgi:hypothetical protein
MLHIACVPWSRLLHAFVVMPDPIGLLITPQGKTIERVMDARDPDCVWGANVPHLRRSSRLRPNPALPGWAEVWCRPSGPLICSEANQQLRIDGCAKSHLDRSDFLPSLRDCRDALCMWDTDPPLGPSRLSDLQSPLLGR